MINKDIEYNKNNIKPYNQFQLFENVKNSYNYTYNKITELCFPRTRLNERTIELTLTKLQDILKDPTIKELFDFAKNRYPTPIHAQLISEIFTDEGFLALKDREAQRRLVFHVLKNQSLWGTFKIVINDPAFKKMDIIAQEGFFGLHQHIHWKQLNTAFISSEVETLFKMGYFGKLEQKQVNQLKSITDSKSTKSLTDGSIKVEQDLLWKEITIHTRFLADFKRLNKQQESYLTPSVVKELYKNPSDLALKTSESKHYTASEAQLQLYLGKSFKDASKFTTKEEWIRFNVGMMCWKIMTRPSIPLIFLSIILALCFPCELTLFIFYTLFTVTILYKFLTPFFSFPYYPISIPFPLFYSWISKKMVDTLTQVLIQERIHNDKIAFYHGAPGDKGALYELYSMFRKRSMITDSGNTIETLRDDEDVFSSIENAQTFKKEISSIWQKKNYIEKLLIWWYDYPDYFTTRAIASNISLWGNALFSGESTVSYWKSSHGEKKLNNELLLAKWLTRIRGEPEKSIHIQERTKKYSEIIQKIGSLSGGTLLQILLEPTSANQISYICEMGGYSLEVDLNGTGKTTDQPEKIISLLKQDPSVLEHTLSQNKARFREYYAVPVNRGSHSTALQARIIVNPVILSDSHKAKINKYDANLLIGDQSPKTIANRKQVEALNKQLNEMLDEDIQIALENKVKYPNGSIAGIEGLTPLQRYYKYVQEGVLGEKVSFKLKQEEAIENRKIFIEKVLKEQLNDIHTAHKQYPDKKLKELLLNVDRTPHEIINLLKGYPELATVYGKRRSGLIGERIDMHILKVMDQFESQKGFLKVLGIDEKAYTYAIRLMRVILAFHYIARSSNWYPDHNTSIELMVRYMAKMGFEKNQIQLAVSLLDNYFLNDYIDSKDDKPCKSRAFTEQAMQTYAQAFGISFKAYFGLQYLVYSSAFLSPKSSKQNKDFGNIWIANTQADLSLWIEEIIKG